MDLFRDLLDAALLDRHKRRIGRVDGLTLEIHDGQPPRVTMMDVGPGVLADRVHPRLGRLVRALLKRLLGIDGDGAAIPLHTIRDIGVDVELSIDAARRADLLQIERLLRRVIAHIPGGSRG